MKVLVTFPARDTSMVFVEELCPRDQGRANWVLGPEDSNLNYYLTCETCGRVLTRLSRGLTLSEIRLGLTCEIHEGDWTLLRSRCRARLEEDCAPVLEAEVAVHDFTQTLRLLVEQRCTEDRGGWTVKRAAEPMTAA